MAKLSPPHIDNILPPFTAEQGLHFPFAFGKTVSAADIRQDAAVIIKDSITNKILFNSEETGEYAIINFEKETISLSFSTTSQFISGNYYKVQTAFINRQTGDIGFYSTVGLARFIYAPEVTIEGMFDEAGRLNTKPTYQYKGKCILNEPSEKIYSYRFTLTKKATNEIIYDTGELIHDTSKDISSTESTDSWYLTQTLQFDETYLIRYSIVTINGYAASSPSYEIEPIDSVNLSLGNNLLIAEPDNENGTIILKFIRKNTDQPFTPLHYNFILLRASEKDNYESWTRMTDFDEEAFSFDNALLSANVILWEDFTVEHGVGYRYALQAYNTFGVVSNKIKSNLTLKVTLTGLPMYNEYGNLEYDSIPTAVYFDDMFLSDGHKQLRIQFNPKVSSFKNAVLETKIDTIGSQHPFFFRNGTVMYKEFPISGLISLLMDPNDKFKVGLYNIKTEERKTIVDYTRTDLVDENIKNERNFKLEVLDWLTNGEVKIFRSAPEGNYLVRLMNTSLSPNDTLGRMLHTFSSTAYEIDKYTFENLDKYGFINFTAPKYKQGSFIGEASIRVQDYLNRNSSPIINIPNAFKATLYETVSCNAKYSLTFTKGNKIDVEIGSSQIYEIPDLGKDNGLISISYANWPEVKEQCQSIVRPLDAEIKVIYGYYDIQNLTNFHFIEDMTCYTRVMQHIGELNYSESTFDFVENPEMPASPIATWGVREMGPMYFVRIKRRPIIPLYTTDGTVITKNGNYLDIKNYNLYFNKSCTNPFSVENNKFLMQGLYLYYVEGQNPLIFDFTDFEVAEDNEKKKYIKPKVIEIDENYNYEVNDKTYNLFDFSFNGETTAIETADTNNIISLQMFNTSNPSKDIESNKLLNIDKQYMGTSFELNTTDLVNTPLESLILNPGLMIEIIYKVKELKYNFNGYEDKMLSNSLSDLDLAHEQYLQAEQSLNNIYNNNYTTTNFLIAKKAYNDAWNAYARLIRNIVYEVSKDEEVTIK